MTKTYTVSRSGYKVTELCATPEAALEAVKKLLAEDVQCDIKIAIRGCRE